MLYIPRANWAEPPKTNISYWAKPPKSPFILESDYSLAKKKKIDLVVFPIFSEKEFGERDY